MNLVWFADILSGNGAFLTTILRGRAGYSAELVIIISYPPSRVD